MKILLSNLMYRQALILIFTNLRRDRDFYMRIEKIEGQNSFSQIVEECAEKLILDLLRERGIDEDLKISPQMTPEYISRYYANSMCYILLDWIRNGMTESPEEMATIYAHLGSHSIIDLLNVNLD